MRFILAGLLALTVMGCDWVFNDTYMSRSGERKEVVKSCHNENLAEARYLFTSRGAEGEQLPYVLHQVSIYEGGLFVSRHVYLHAYVAQEIMELICAEGIHPSNTAKYLNERRMKQ